MITINELMCKGFDVNEQGNITYYDEKGMFEFLKTFIYEVKYDL